MPEFNIKESIITSLNAQEPWPDNVKLYQPYEVEQILLPDNASCLAVQAFLKMCNLPFEVEMRWNAEFMSPSGRVPFIKCGAFVVSELEPIVQFAANKGVSLCTKLGTEEKAEMRAYMSLITNVLVNAELYISWVDNDTFNTVTKIRNSSVYPWPLGWLQTRSKRNAVIKRLRALHWHDKTLDQVLADATISEPGSIICLLCLGPAQWREPIPRVLTLLNALLEEYPECDVFADEWMKILSVEQCCNSLSQRLGDRDYFFGTPTPLDVIIYGHMRALLSAFGPKAAQMIKPITSSLLRHTIRMSNITKMKLTPQEDYLITQAFQISARRRVSPERTISERSTRMRRSKLCLRNSSREFLNCTNGSREGFGFKPFASKQLIIKSTKDGKITCEHDQKVSQKETYFDVYEIVEEIFDKVDELSKANEKHDFEMIPFTHYGDSKCESPDLDTIDENDATDTTVSIDIVTDDIGNDDTVNDDTVNDDTVNDSMDSDVLANDAKILTTEAMKSLTKVFDKDSDVIESSNTLKVLNESSSDRCSVWDSSNNDVTPIPASAQDSKSTLKMPSNEEMSVESLLSYLRLRNAHCGLLVGAVDVD